MISTPEIIQTKAEEAAVIHLTVPRSAMMKVFGPAVGELMAALAEQAVKPVGAVFAHHLKMSPDTFDFELGVKVSAPVKAAGRVKPGELPEQRLPAPFTAVPTKASRLPGVNSISGWKRTATSRQKTSGSCIRSGRSRRLIRQIGARS